MEALPLLLLVLAAFVVARLVQMALDPAARQNRPAPVAATSGEAARRGTRAR